MNSAGKEKAQSDKGGAEGKKRRRRSKRIGGSRRMMKMRRTGRKTLLLERMRWRSLVKSCDIMSKYSGVSLSNVKNINHMYYVN